MDSSLVRYRSRVRVPPSAPKKSFGRAVFYEFVGNRFSITIFIEVFSFSTIFVLPISIIYEQKSFAHKFCS